MTKLCPRGKAAAKRKFRVYPSAYANAYASKICAGKIKDPSGVKRKDFRGPKPAGKVAGGEAKIKKVAGALHKASRLHKAQAKSLDSVVKSKSGKMIKAGLGTLVRDLFTKVTGKRKSAISSNTSDMGFKKGKIPLANLYQRAVAQKKVESKKAKSGAFVQTLEPYNGTYIKGNLAGHEVSNKSLKNYYKGMLND